MQAEAIVCSACALCFLPISLPIICVEHCIQREKALSGIIPTYPYPIKACCKNGSYFPCCPFYNMHYQEIYTSETDVPSQKIMPTTPTKKINTSIYSKF